MLHEGRRRTALRMMGQRPHSESRQESERAPSKPRLSQDRQRASGSDVSHLPCLLPAPWSRDRCQVAIARMPASGHETDAQTVRGCSTCRCTRSCLKGSQVDWLQRCLRWPAQHGTSGVKARAVAGTIPGTIGRVPADQAVQMRADRGTDRHVACVIAIRRVFLPLQAHDFSCPVGHVVEGVGVSACETIAEQVVRIIEILLHIPPEATMKRPPIHAE
jgi:hypothetical protein